MGGENGGGVAVGDAGDIGEDVLIVDKGHGFLESVSVGLAVEAVPCQVLNVGVS